MRHALLVTAALLAVSAARAASVVYDHPVLKVRLTVHSAQGSSVPDALSYEGPKGFFLVTNAELRALEHGDGYSDLRYDVVALTAEGLLRWEDPYYDVKTCGFADDACVAAIEKTLDELIGRGKQEAPDEFAARVAALHRRVDETRATWRSLETEASAVSGTTSDEAALDAATAPLADAESAVEAARAARVTGEYRASVAAPTAADPSPKADFYWRESRALDGADAALSRADATLAAARTPAY